ncbi:uncharacterized protein RCO7_03119 [Rhynchosporium graminicola]|uniref:Uncharacterized protein n=1 Tax=Rhynchosporium graminicola TaxID=2792576 RepID=A0A1E1KRZ3_9HELO|nr:uncharacterized protein RCO7_03119 [Rhynchosporium commune]
MSFAGFPKRPATSSSFAAAAISIPNLVLERQLYHHFVAPSVLHKRVDMKELSAAGITHPPMVLSRFNPCPAGVPDTPPVLSSAFRGRNQPGPSVRSQRQVSCVPDADFAKAQYISGLKRASGDIVHVGKNKKLVTVLAQAFDRRSVWLSSLLEIKLVSCDSERNTRATLHRLCSEDHGTCVSTKPSDGTISSFHFCIQAAEGRAPHIKRRDYCAARTSATSNLTGRGSVLTMSLCLIPSRRPGHSELLNPFARIVTLKQVYHVIMRRRTEGGDGISDAALQVRTIFLFCCRIVSHLKVTLAPTLDSSSLSSFSKKYSTKGKCESAELIHKPSPEPQLYDAPDSVPAESIKARAGFTDSHSRDMSVELAVTREPNLAQIIAGAKVVD